MSDDQAMEENLGWALIPPNVLSDEKLTSTEKLLLGRIIGLSGKSGHCFAGNAWLGEGLGLAKGTVSNVIAILVTKGYVRRELIRDPETNEIKERHLYPLSTSQWIPPPHSYRSTSPAESGREGRVEGKVKKKKKPPSDKPRRETVKKKDLDHLTNGYTTRKGIEPQGDEWKPIQQAFRYMLLDGNTVEQIEGCEDAIVKEGWTWTFNTVRRWMPDFRAGKFPSTDGRDADRIRALRDDIGEIDRYVEDKLKPRLAKLEWRDVDVGDLTVEEAEDMARLQRLRRDKMKERKRLVQELGK